MKRLTAIIIAAMLLGINIAHSQNPLASERPRLVLILLIDNLNNEQLNIIRHQCGNDGFNRIYREGTSCTNAYYDAGGNYAGKNIATFFTGAPAATHGVVSEYWINNFDNKKMHAIYADAYDNLGRFKNDTVTPNNKLLLCSTIGNQIRKMYNKDAKIISLGFHPEMLLWCSGAMQAEPTFWFDTKDGQFVGNNVADSTTQTIIDEFNSKKIADIYIDRQWGPQNDISQYHEWRYFKNDNTQRSFYYNMRVDQPTKAKYSKIAGSPYGNSLLRDLAAATLIDAKLGKNDIPDVLTLQFSATPAVGHKIQPLDAESEDMLLCLDKDIASLLKVIDHEIGMDNTLVILSATQGSYDLSHTPSEQWNSRGAVSLTRVSALLNLYLMALHGQGKWVANYKSGEIYLNKELCKEKSVDFKQLCSEAAEFLTQMQGIGTSVIASELQNSFTISPIVNGMKRNYHPKRSGDILFALEPGWAEEQEDGSQIMQLWGQEFVPLIFSGWKIPQNNVIYKRHNMADVAPTICTFLNLAKPDGCSGTEIELENKSGLK